MFKYWIINVWTINNLRKSKTNMEINAEKMFTHEQHFLIANRNSLPRNPRSAIIISRSQTLSVHLGHIQRLSIRRSYRKSHPYLFIARLFHLTAITDKLPRPYRNLAGYWLMENKSHDRKSHAKHVFFFWHLLIAEIKTPNRHKH